MLSLLIEIADKMPPRGDWWSWRMLIPGACVALVCALLACLGRWTGLALALLLALGWIGLTWAELSSPLFYDVIDEVGLSFYADELVGAVLPLAAASAVVMTSRHRRWPITPVLADPNLALSPKESV